MTDPKDFIFTHDMTVACSEEYTDYCSHIICLKGSARFEIDDNLYNIVANDIMIKSTPKAVGNLICSDDFKIEALLVSWDYLRKNSPKSDYQITGYLSMIENPVYAVNRHDTEQIRHDFREIRIRLSQRYNNFFDDILRREVELMIFDFYDMHSRRYNIKVEGQSRAAEILSQFIALLQKGLYRENRRVDYYASLLFITPKYLSEACIDASGYNASYWIDYFTTDAIRHELHETGKSLQQIADEYHFSSLSYFSRYVKNHLKLYPSEYRKNNITKE